MLRFLLIVFLGFAEQGITGLFARLLPEPRGSEVVDSRFPGTVSHDFQEKEALYNAYLRQVEAQEARGWQVRKGWQHKPKVGESAVFIVAVSDRDGAPVSGATVSGRFLRTSNSRDDFAFAMDEAAPGEYRVQLTMPLPGLWELVLQVRRGDDLHEVRAQSGGCGDFFQQERLGDPAVAAAIAPGVCEEPHRQPRAGVALEIHLLPTGLD